MEFTKTFKRLRDFEERVQKLSADVAEIKKKQREHFEKIMQGFKCIERAFKCNCNAQIALCGQIDEMQGGVTDLSLYQSCPVSSASES